MEQKLLWQPTVGLPGCYTKSETGTLHYLKLFPLPILYFSHHQRCDIINGYLDYLFENIALKFGMRIS